MLDIDASIILCHSEKENATPIDEPKKIRYRLLHAAARITRSAGRTRLRIASAGSGRHTWLPRRHRRVPSNRAQ